MQSNIVLHTSYQAAAATGWQNHNSLNRIKFISLPLTFFFSTEQWSKVRPGAYCFVYWLCNCHILFLKFIFLLKDNCFREFCCFSVKPQCNSHISLRQVPPSAQSTDKEILYLKRRDLSKYLMGWNLNPCWSDCRSKLLLCFIESGIKAY